MITLLKNEAGAIKQNMCVSYPACSPGPVDIQHRIVVTGFSNAIQRIAAYEAHLIDLEEAAIQMLKEKEADLTECKGVTITARNARDAPPKIFDGGGSRTFSVSGG